MKAPFSQYLVSIKSAIKALIESLEKDYNYVSALATDSKGFAVRVSQTSKSVSSETMTTERGIVLRVCRNGLYSEYALNSFDPASPLAEAEEIKKALDRQFALLESTGTAVYETPVLSDDEETVFVEKETELLPEGTDLKELVEYLSALSDRAMTLGEHMLECSTSAQSTHICKMFLTKNRDLRQSYFSD